MGNAKLEEYVIGSLNAGNLPSIQWRCRKRKLFRIKLVNRNNSKWSPEKLLEGYAQLDKQTGPYDFVILRRRFVGALHTNKQFIKRPQKGTEGGYKFDYQYVGNLEVPLAPITQANNQAVESSLPNQSVNSIWSPKQPGYLTAGCPSNNLDSIPIQKLLAAQPANEVHQTFMKSTDTSIGDAQSTTLLESVVSSSQDEPLMYLWNTNQDVTVPSSSLSNMYFNNNGGTALPVVPVKHQLEGNISIDDGTGNLLVVPELNATITSTTTTTNGNNDINLNSIAGADNNIPIGASDTSNADSPQSIIFSPLDTAFGLYIYEKLSSNNLAILKYKAPQLIVKNIQYSGRSIERDACKTHHRPILVTSEHTREQSTHIQQTHDIICLPSADQNVEEGDLRKQTDRILKKMKEGITIVSEGIDIYATSEASITAYATSAYYKPQTLPRSQKTKIFDMDSFYKLTLMPDRINCNPTVYISLGKLWTTSVTEEKARILLSVDSAVAITFQQMMRQGSNLSALDTMSSDFEESLPSFLSRPSAPEAALDPHPVTFTPSASLIPTTVMEALSPVAQSQGDMAVTS